MKLFLSLHSSIHNCKNAAVRTMVFAFVISALVLWLFFPSSSIPQSEISNPQLAPGQSVTLLPDGRWLLLGGEDSDGTPLATASIYDPRSGTVSVLSAQSSSLNYARAYHSATVLPDGAVLVFGGISADGQVLAAPEIFDPATETFQSLQSAIQNPQSEIALAPRAYHTATLLTDGQILIAGGIGPDDEPLDFAELVSPQSSSLSPESTIPHSEIRIDGTATLLSDGTVLLWGGFDGDGNELDTGDLYDPSTNQFIPQSTLPNPQSELPNPQLEASLPLDGSVDAPLDAIIALRFSTPLRVETVNTDTVTLLGPNGMERIKVVPAEGGMLAFITPEAPLLPGATYTVSIRGATDQSGSLLPVSGFSFTTQSSAISGQQSAGTTSAPFPSESAIQNPKSKIRGVDWEDGWVWRGELRDGKPHSPWQDLPPLQAEPGVTAVAGQVLDLKGDPLANVTLAMEGMYGEEETVQTDETGRFLLKYTMSGWCELWIDGRSAHNPKSKIENPKWGYGTFEYGLDIKESETNVLPFTIWLPKIDTAHAVKISSPTTSEVVVTTPHIPGLELHLAPDTVIRDHEGKVVTEVSLTPIPVDRPPFPLPKDVQVPIYFTAQPGGAYVYRSPGARIYYPNYTNKLPGTRFNFWHYDPEYEGWYIYGLGTVIENGTQVVPDPGVSIYEFTGAMVANPNLAPPEGPPPCKVPGKCKDGDPVDLYSGLLVVEKTDLTLPDILSIHFTRTYRQRDTISRAFGIGASHSYDMFLVGDTFPYTFTDLILPDGGRIHYDRISPGTSYTDVVYEHTSTPTQFYKSQITWNGAGWDLKLKDGTVYSFRDGFGASRPGQAGLLKIKDRNGNTLTATRDSNGNVTKITSPNGRWIDFTTDVSNRITQAKDNIGRTYTYTYDGTGRLSTVTDPNGGVTTYTYDTSSRMLTIQDARGIVFLTNQYDATGKLINQTQADSSTYLFAYTTDGNGKVIQTDVTDPRGNIRRVTFNPVGQILTDTRAFGTSIAQTTTYALQTGTNLVLSITDALNRTTVYAYDSMGNVTSVTRLSGTADEVTTTYAYEPTFNQVISITDPLNHTTTIARDAKGNPISATNPLNNTTTIAYNVAGQPISIADPLNNTTQFAYDFGDLVTVTDPLGNRTNRFIDAAGRLLALTDSLGQTTLYDYDALNRLTQVADPLGGLTQFGYDANGNLTGVTDARNNATSYSYNSMDRLATRTDPLTKVESYGYDQAGNLTTFTDRKTQATGYTYDALNRRTQATYADPSTTSYTYDAGNRLTQAVDSISGTIAGTYDGLDRLMSETTPQGSVSYTYDSVGRRTSMTVAGQPSVLYSYDNANRLTQITQGSSIVSFTYDAASKRTSLTLPNGIVAEYTYDAASRVTGITYKQGITVLGDLTYEYDQTGNRTKIGGSWARSGLPGAVGTTSYDAGNRQLTFEDKTLTYDDNGNLTTMTDASGTTIYTWNARNQLAGINGPGLNASFTYDGIGRQHQKTIDGSLTEFVYDGVNPVQETSGSTVLANILTGLGIDEFFTRTDVGAGTTSHFLPDALGSALALTDAAGAIQTEYTYEPFGGTTATGASNASPFQYTGRENDATGLYHYRARYYHVALQRFISEDPIGFYGGDSNLYAYVGNSPATFVDPLGWWRSAGHTDLTTTGAANAGGFSAGDINDLVNANTGMDWGPSTFDPWSPQHYMPGTDREAEKFINDRLQDAINRDLNGDREGAMKSLGEGAHTLQDKWSHAKADPPGTMKRHACARVGLCDDPDSPDANPSGYKDALRDTERYLKDFQHGRGIK